MSAGGAAVPGRSRVPRAAAERPGRVFSTREPRNGGVGLQDDVDSGGAYRFHRQRWPRLPDARSAVIFPRGPAPGHRSWGDQDGGPEGGGPKATQRGGRDGAAAEGHWEWAGLRLAPHSAETLPLRTPHWIPSGRAISEIRSSGFH